MQPPATPTSNRRSHFPSSCQSFSAGPTTAPRRSGYQSRPNSFLRLFIGALAISASKTWVIDSHGEEGGGAGWLVLAYWASRLFVEGKQVCDGRRRKGTRSDATSIGIGVKVSVQTMLYSKTSLMVLGLLIFEFQLRSTVTCLLHVSGLLRSIQVKFPDRPCSSMLTELCRTSIIGLTGSLLATSQLTTIRSVRSGEVAWKI